MKIILSDIERSPFWSFSSEVEQICEPLFERFGINYFDYTRFYRDSTCISFFSEQKYVKYFLANAEYRCPTGRIPPGKYLWQSYIGSEFLAEISDNFNHYHGITYVRESIEYSELFNFSAPKEKEGVLKIYLNYEEVLDYFVSFFLKSIEPFLKKNKSTRIFLPEEFIGDSANKMEKKLTINNFILQLHGNNNSNRISHLIRVGEELISLTTREVQCLAYLVKGCSGKQIARGLDLSTRTIEKFCANILVKINVPTRSELIAKLDSNTINLLKILGNYSSPL